MITLVIAVADKLNGGFTGLAYIAAMCLDAWVMIEIARVFQ